MSEGLFGKGAEEGCLAQVVILTAHHNTLIFLVFCYVNFFPRREGSLSCGINLACQSNEKCMPALGSSEPRLVSSSYLISAVIIIQESSRAPQNHQEENTNGYVRHE